MATDYDQPMKNDDFSGLYKLMRDIDCVQLGYDEEVFIANREKIRSEHPYVSDEAFAKGTKQFFVNFMKDRTHETMFYLSYFQERYGQQAYQNISKLIG